ncbi:hypothetical protein TB2_021087 [Malus domestica]
MSAESQMAIFQCGETNLEQERGSLERPVHAYGTTIKELDWLYELGGFIWLSYMPRGWFQPESDQSLNGCSVLEASIGSDLPDLMCTSVDFISSITASRKSLNRSYCIG